jgi:hypothetical protein
MPIPHAECTGLQAERALGTSYTDRPSRPDWLAAILSEPTTTVPLAGKALGIKGRNQSYEAARRGEILTLRFGRTLRVPTAWLRRKLMLDGSEAA